MRALLKVSCVRAIDAVLQRSANVFYQRAKRLVDKMWVGDDTDESYLGLAKLLNIVNGACSAGDQVYAQPFNKLAISSKCKRLSPGC